MPTDLTVARAALITALGAPDHVPTVIDPPCVLVEPGDPYLAYDEHYKRHGLIATIDVYVLVPEGDNEFKGKLLDSGLLAALTAIEGTADWGVERIGKPGSFFTADWSAYGVLVTVKARVSRT